MRIKMKNGKLNNEALKPVKPSFLYLKARAKALYIAGYSPTDIAKSLGIKRKEVITNWAKKENWMEERNKTLEITTSNRLQELLKQQEISLGDLKAIRDKAIDSINKDLVSPSKFSEAANSYISALEMERKMKIEALQISFISDVAQILKEEIQDKNLLFNIAERFRELFSKYQSKQLSEGKKIEE